MLVDLLYIVYRICCFQGDSQVIKWSTERIYFYFLSFSAICNTCQTTTLLFKVETPPIYATLQTCSSFPHFIWFLFFFPESSLPVLSGLFLCNLPIKYRRKMLVLPGNGRQVIFTNRAEPEMFQPNWKVSWLWPKVCGKSLFGHTDWLGWPLSAAIPPSEKLHLVFLFLQHYNSVLKTVNGLPISHSWQQDFLLSR